MSLILVKSAKTLIDPLLNVWCVAFSGDTFSIGCTYSDCNVHLKVSTEAAMADKITRTFAQILKVSKPIIQHWSCSLQYLSISARLQYAIATLLPVSFCSHVNQLGCIVCLFFVMILFIVECKWLGVGNVYFLTMDLYDHCLIHGSYYILALNKSFGFVYNFWAMGATSASFLFSYFTFYQHKWYYSNKHR